MYKHKPILVILIWGLIIEIFILFYYVLKSNFTLEFYIDIFLLIFTGLGVYMVIRKIIKEVRKKD